MPGARRVVFLIAVSSLLTSAVALATPPLAARELAPEVLVTLREDRGAGLPPRERTLTIVSDVALDLGEALVGIDVVGFAADGDDVRVEQRFETAMTIMNEGGHVDLVDWKHGATPWLTLTRDVGGRFRAAPRAEGPLPFPPVKANDIVDAAKKAGADARYLELARSCASATSYPCDVGVSRIVLRVLRREKDQERNAHEWRTVRVVYLNAPMGC